METEILDFAGIVKFPPNGKLIVSVVIKSNTPSLRLKTVISSDSGRLRYGTGRHINFGGVKIMRLEHGSEVG